MRITDDDNNIFNIFKIIDNEKLIHHDDSEIESINCSSDKGSSKEFVRIEAKFDQEE